ncbi:PKD domain containing protein [Chthoniobacter flavus Ellin428]|uniref:PKD domain containing protein n=1 Tax=Chthoniobacter flavus Ellin428 TaxID=497964 RepID=B4CUW8_9BACT|nr:LamG-like jellyroll fold domain-containing protein [Chthoniobacter flavus]EDY22356.1 PKD domain containing protein [Chthoniobacter flavus Ellin428]
MLPKLPAVLCRGLVLALLCTAATLRAQINQATFTAAEVGTVIYQFDHNVVGLQATMADLQHGRMYIGAGQDSQPGSLPVITWWDMSNPRTPVLDTRIQLASGNKPHVCTWWGNNLATGHQGLSRIWDFTTKTELSTYGAGIATGVWRTVQPPYEYEMTNGYGAGPPTMDIAKMDLTTTARTRLKQIDLSQLVGFYIGATHAVGNLLICSASQTNGVAVFDISDPENPRVLSSLITANPVYTSFVHGSRLYTGEHGVVGVYDFSDPQNITFVGSVSSGGADARYISVKEGIGYTIPGAAKLIVFDANTLATLNTYTLPSPGDFNYPLGNMLITGGQVGRNLCGIIPIAQNPDTQGPAVTFASPSDGATRQALTSRVGLIMSDQIDVTSMTTSTFIVRPLGSTTALTGTYSTQMGVINFAPDVPLLANTIYEVILPVGGVRDVVGNGLRQEFRMRFSTGDHVDDTTLGLVSRYHFDETSGTIAVDDISSRNGTLTNFPATPWGPGVINGALTFDGVDDYVNVGTYDLGNTFTVASWVKIPSGEGSLHTVFGNSPSNYQSLGFKLFIYGSTNASAGQIRVESGNGTLGDAAVTANGVFQYDQWNHVALTIDRNTGAAHIYYNGVDRASDTTVRTDFPTNQLIQIGQMTNGSNRMKGQLDELNVFNRVLYPSEIQALRTQRDGPIAWWRFNNSTADDSGGSHPVILQGGATYTATAMEGAGALSIPAAANYADAGTMDLGQSFTWSGWVQAPSGSGNLQTIFATSATGSNTAGVKLFLYGSTNTQAGRLRIETGNGSAGGDAFTNTGVFTFDQWNHVAVTVDRSTGTAAIYVNGVDMTADASVRNDFPTNQQLLLGRMTDGGSPLLGALDDVRIYGRALTLDDVRELSIRTPLAVWPMDNSTADQGGFGRTLNLINAPSFSTDHAIGTHSLLLNGSGQRANSAAFDIGNTTTLSAWVKIPSTSTGLQTILANGTWGYNTAGFRLFVYAAGQTSLGRIQLETGNGTLGAAAYTAVGTFQFDQWNHVAVTINRTAGTARIYYNRQDATAGQTVRTDFNTNAGMEIGSMAGGNVMVGRIDEVRVYGAIATAAQINALGAGSPNAAPVVTTVASTNPKQTTNSAVTFTATATDANVGEPLSYSFDFGDGSHSAWSGSTSASHTYAAPGRYVVTAFVDDGYTISQKTFVQIVYRPLTANPPTKSGQVAYDSTLNKVWIVNPDIDTVTRMDGSSRLRDFEIAVGTKPNSVAVRPGGAEVWVSCRESGNVYVLNASTGAVLQTILLGRAYQPMGIAFAPNGSAAFVACEGAAGLFKIDPATRAVTGSLDLAAEARAVAISADSTRVFVTRFLSPDTQGQVWEVDPSTMALAPITTTRPANPFALGIETTPDSASGGSGLPNYLLDAGISPDGKRLWIPAKKDNINRGTGPGHSGLPLTEDNTVRSILRQIDLAGGSEVTLARKDIDNQGMPSAVCFSPVGDLAFVTYITNNEVLVFDTTTGNQVAGIVVASAPSGLTIKPDGTRLYVHNFLSRTVTTLDITGLVNATSSAMIDLGQTTLIATEKLTATVLAGKKIFYNADDPRMSAEGYISCATCHLDGGSDGRTWDFTDRGEGFRQTITLLGRSGTGNGPVHWTGNFDEIQDFEIDIRNAFGGSGFITNGTPNPSLGASNAGRSADLDALAAYVSSLNAYPKSPYRNADGSNTAAAINGAQHFQDKGCATCHSGTNFTDSAVNLLHDVGTISTASGKRLGQTLTGFDTPTLRGVWQTGPYLHRGQAADLPSVFNTTNAPTGKGHDRFRELTATEQNELIEFLLELE